MVSGVSSWLALVVAIVCGVLLARLLMRAPTRARFDRFWRERVGLASVRGGRRLMGRVRRVARRRADRDTAARVAQDAIERARRARPQVDKQGNVYTPRSFKGPRRPH